MFQPRSFQSAVVGLWKVLLVSNKTTKFSAANSLIIIKKRFQRAGTATQDSKLELHFFSQIAGKVPQILKGYFGGNAGKVPNKII